MFFFILLRSFQDLYSFTDPQTHFHYILQSVCARFKFFQDLNEFLEPHSVTDESVSHTLMNHAYIVYLVGSRPLCKRCLWLQGVKP